MRILIFCSIVACLAPGHTYGDESEGQLLVTLDAATIVIQPRPSDSGPINLPGIEFAMHVETRCSDDMQAESVSVSVADTRVNFGPDELLEQDKIEASIRIPGKQIAPLAIDSFCVAEEGETVNARLRVHDVLTAQVSLKCAAEDQQSIFYQTAVLDLVLTCESPDGD